MRNISPTNSLLFLLPAILFFCNSPLFSNVIWPAIYVSDSLYRLWYIALLTILIEAIVISGILHFNFKKSVFIATVSNVLSGLSGIFLLPVSMLGWEFMSPDFFGPTFSELNKAFSIIIMCLLSCLIEIVAVRIIWRIQIIKSIIPFSIGNFLSYSAIAIDLYYLGGWNRSY